MINWEKQLPTFARWGRGLTRSQVFRVSRDSWRGIEWRCDIGVGRGVLRVTLWEIGPQGTRILDSVESPAESLGQITESLDAALRSIGATGLPCELLLNPPWAVAKVLPLTVDEVCEPTQWIARHRSEVFPTGIEADTCLTYSIRARQDHSSNLIIGLTRRSTLEPLLEAIARAGCTVRATVIGPIAALDRMDAKQESASCIAIERTGTGSVGCWISQDSGGLGWTEFPIEADSSLENSLPERLQALVDDTSDPSEFLPFVEIPSWRPPIPNVSRWRPPLKESTRQNEGHIERPRSDRIGPVVQSWLGWVLRWSVVLAMSGLLLSVANFAISGISHAITRQNTGQVAASTERWNALLTEWRTLEKQVGKSEQPSSMINLGRVWLELGSNRPTGLWLRQVKMEPRNADGRTLTIMIEGVASDKDAPQQYTDNLKTNSAFSARTTRLERMDTSKLKDAPASLRDELYRFAIELRP